MVARIEVRFVRCQIFGGHGEHHRRSSQQETYVILIGKVYIINIVDSVHSSTITL